MLGSNQRPLPCEVKAFISPVFAVVQKYVQNGPFSLNISRVYSPLFAWVGVLIGVAWDIPISRPAEAFRTITKRLRGWIGEQQIHHDAHANT